MTDFVVVPNAGLFPEVSEARPVVEEDVDSDLMSLMQMTNSERASLQEAGVPETMIQRLEAFLVALSDHQAAERGGEARWALGRALHRAEEGLDAVENIVRILARRLRPQGFLPVVRIPNTEASMWRLFSWARNGLNFVFERTLEHHLRTPLQPSETVPSPQFLPESTSSPATPGSSAIVDSGEPPSSRNETTPAELPSSSTNATRVSRDRSRSPRSASPAARLPAQPLATEVPRWMLNLDPAILDGALQGIWAEPVEDGSSSSQRLSSSSSTTTVACWSTSLPTLRSSTCSLGSWESCGNTSRSSSSSSSPSSTPTSSSTSPSLSAPTTSSSPPSTEIDREGDVLADQLSLVQTWGSGVTWNIRVGTASSSSSTTTLASPVDVVRDSVNRLLIQGGRADTIDLIRRLLDRRRRLQHCDRLIGEALEEALSWLPIPLHAVPLNAATFEEELMGIIEREAAFGSQPSTSSSSQAVGGYAVLLEPGLPPDLPTLWRSIPLPERPVVVGLRRRAWRNHVRQLHQVAGLPLPTPAADTLSQDGPLYLVQTDAEAAVPNFPGRLPELPHRVRAQTGVATRRRFRQRRPVPRFPSLVPRRRRHRGERSRSRDRSADDSGYGSGDSGGLGFVADPHGALPVPSPALGSLAAAAPEPLHQLAEVDSGDPLLNHGPQPANAENLSPN